MKYELFTRVALKADLPKHGLRAGDVATVVEFHPGQPPQEPGYSLEVFNDVVLARDLPEHRLKRGDMVKLVEHHPGPNGTEGYSAKVFNALGNTLAVITVPDSALEPLRENEVLCARVLAAA